jgi:hypothetical protein
LRLEPQPSPTPTPHRHQPRHRHSPTKRAPDRDLSAQLDFCERTFSFLHRNWARGLSASADRGMRPLHPLSFALQLSTAGFKALSPSGEKRLFARWVVSDLCCLSLLAWAVGWSGATRHHSHPAPCRVRRRALANRRR